VIERLLLSHASILLLLVLVSLNQQMSQSYHLFSSDEEEVLDPLYAGEHDDPIGFFFSNTPSTHTREDCLAIKFHNKTYNETGTEPPQPGPSHKQVRAPSPCYGDDYPPDFPSWSEALMDLPPYIEDIFRDETDKKLKKKVSKKSMATLRAEIKQLNKKRGPLSYAKIDTPGLWFDKFCEEHTDASDEERSPTPETRKNWDDSIPREEVLPTPTTSKPKERLTKQEKRKIKQQRKKNSKTAENASMPSTHMRQRLYALYIEEDSSDSEWDITFNNQVISMFDIPSRNESKNKAGPSFRTQEDQLELDNRRAQVHPPRTQTVLGTPSTVSYADHPFNMTTSNPTSTLFQQPKEEAVPGDPDFNRPTSIQDQFNDELWDLPIPKMDNLAQLEQLEKISTDRPFNAWTWELERQVKLEELARQQSQKKNQNGQSTSKRPGNEKTWKNPRKNMRKNIKQQTTTQSTNTPAQPKYNFFQYSLQQLFILSMLFDFSTRYVTFKRVKSCGFTPKLPAPYITCKEPDQDTAERIAKIRSLDIAPNRIPVHTREEALNTATKPLRFRAAVNIAFLMILEAVWSPSWFSPYHPFFDSFRNYIQLLSAVDALILKEKWSNWIPTKFQDISLEILGYFSAALQTNATCLRETILIFRQQITPIVDSFLITRSNSRLDILWDNRQDDIEHPITHSSSSIYNLTSAHIPHIESWRGARDNVKLVKDFVLLQGDDLKEITITFQHVPAMRAFLEQQGFQIVSQVFPDMEAPSVIHQQIWVPMIKDINCFTMLPQTIVDGFLLNQIKHQKAYSQLLNHTDSLLPTLQLNPQPNIRDPTEIIQTSAEGIKNRYKLKNLLVTSNPARPSTSSSSSSSVPELQRR